MALGFSLAVVVSRIAKNQSQLGIPWTLLIVDTVSFSLQTAPPLFDFNLLFIYLFIYLFIGVHTERSSVCKWVCEFAALLRKCRTSCRERATRRATTASSASASTCWKPSPARSASGTPST